MCMRWMCPPPRRMPLRFVPARALPVPFWRYIFFVEPATMPRDFVWCEPWRSLAWYITTASCSNCLLMRAAKSVGSTLYVPTFLPLRSWMVSLGMEGLRVYGGESRVRRVGFVCPQLSTLDPQLFHNMFVSRIIT